MIIEKLNDNFSKEEELKMSLQAIECLLMKDSLIYNSINFFIALTNIYS